MPHSLGRSEVQAFHLTLADGGRGRLGVEGILSKGCLSKLLLFWLFDRRKQALGLFCTHYILRLLAFQHPVRQIFEAKRKCGELTAESFLGLEVPSQPAFFLFQSCLFNI